ncbi:Os07g0645900 [Oryza sativa Japonica Group]|uniref:Os07g0645900 protein n=1 Tax=Oryza sativa subsp. japonica TaxID=39947 RepID=A0A0P0X9P9_ORYSJ|nr:Os07g0645900 [Oryza sativa Japonica Group]
MGLSRQFLNLLVDNGIPRAKSLHCVKLTRHRLFNTTKPTMLPLIGDGNEPKNNNQSMEKIVLPRPSFNLQLLGQEEDRRSEMQEQRDANDDDKEVTDDEDYSMDILFPKSRHRDGSIYRGIMDTWWKKELRIADRNEKLAEIHNDGCLVELYGYIAVRDDLDPLLNYIINFSRDDPIIVEQGSLINMMGPKRGIDLMDFALIEFDVRIKTGEQEKDDLQLIDGATLLWTPGLWNQPYSIKIPGDYGAVDITVAHLNNAVEATVEVVISEVQSGFNLLLGCLTSDLNKEMRLFDGAIVESRFLKRSVVAVNWKSSIDLKFKVGASPSSFDQHCVSFKPKIHGHDTQEIKTDFALISVKVTWSTLLPTGLD